MSRQTLNRTLGILALTVTCWAGAAHAAWLWDQNADKIDDRIAAVEAAGPLAARVGGLASGRLRFALMTDTAPFRYGVYVGYDHHPTDADAAALQALGVTPQVRYRHIDYIRAEVTAAEAALVAQLPGVTRVETIPIMYAVNDVATQVLRARPSGGALFPDVWTHLGVTGEGVTVAILDSGVNDEANGLGYPGHESLRGKFLGGGSFFAGNPALNTPPDSSENPRHEFDPEATYHGTHVAGTAIGSGGPEGVLNGAAPGFYAGIAPNARLVDCKVLSDAGLGFGAADALDWLITHRNDDWGLTGADLAYRGVDVANLSIGGTDNSDGSDASCAAVNAAVRAGIVCCVATGNDGNTGWMASPAAADLAVSVGAFVDDNTVAREDDLVTDYSNEGPRLADADADHFDEMKPVVTGSGTGILSALGDITSDGRRYHHINGTSMACPSVAGVAALVRSANPSLTAADVARILRETAEHRRAGGKQPESAADPYGLDPNYHPSWGWGQADAYAAVKEALNPLTTQMVRFALEPQRGPDGVLVKWWVQRELRLVRYVVERAPDAFGAPGAWQPVHEAPAQNPVYEISGLPNRRLYAHTDLDPALDPSATYWYRLTWVDFGGVTHHEPALAVRIADSPVRARIHYAWTHDYSNGDLAVRFGTGTDTANPVWWRAGEGASAADSVETVPGDPYLGTQKHYFHVDLTDEDLVGGYLPPGPANPWFLSVKEGGYINTTGKVDAFSITVFGESGPETFTSPQTTTPNVEKQETVFWIPLPPPTTVNHPPVIQSIAPPTVGEGLTLQLTVVAGDPDDDPLTFSALDLPPGATFDPPTRRFTWTPGYSDAGTRAVRFVVTDDGFPVAAADTERVVITVVERAPGQDLPPVFDAQSDRSGYVGERLAFRMRARDPEGTAITYAVLSAPAGVTMDPASGVVEWTPAASGAFTLRLLAEDLGGQRDTADVVALVSTYQEGPPPVLPCSESASVIAGVVDAGTPAATTEVVIPFTVAPGIQRIEATMTWFLGPATDLDLYLLDENLNVVQSAATTDAPEHLLYLTQQAGQYYWRVVSYASPDTAEFTIESVQCASMATGVEPGRGRAGLWMAPAAPNPFRGETRLAFAVPRDAEVALRLYDVAGRRIRTLQDGRLPAGQHARLWDRRTDRGELAAPGLYFARLVVDGRESRSQKVILAP